MGSYGYDGLFDRRTGKPSPKRVPLATVEEILRLYQEQYSDFNVQHFHEKLLEKHQIRLSYTWVKRALQMAGLVKKSSETRNPSAPAGTPPAAGDVAAPRWQLARLVPGRPPLRSAGPPRRCHQRDLLRTVGGRRVHRHGDESSSRGDRAERGFLRAVQRSCDPFLSHAESRPGGRPEPPYPGGAGASGDGDSDDSGLFAASARKRRT